MARGERVTSVAPNVGYESPGAFAALFRKITGHSPAAYIKLCSERDILRICKQSICQEKNYEL
ncbi:helix-turn-helix domain-containing protein [Acetobacter indonesiensis]|uniref:helix-turn-helix domain-containing protein n=1 Tax=Acetobacter indonesiensis TaxID=104101 RepID=UPI00211B653C|nr:AraC family transcriptional regulator [Acetobacter indonesiensis]